jgi:hypothetical protein
MALDTAAKRASALGVVVATLLIIPDGTIAQGDRQTIGDCYSGILAAAPVVVSPDCYTAVDSLVEPFNAVTGLIDDAPIVTAGLIGEFTARNSLIDASDIVLSSVINENGINTDSAIQPVFALNGELCDCG